MVPSDKATSERSKTPAKVTEKLSDDVLFSIGDSGDAFADAIAYVNEHGEVFNAGDVLGNGFKILSREDKATLVGVPLLILTSEGVDTMRMGDYGPFVTLFIVTEDGRKFILNDGSTGIRDQMHFYWQKTKRIGGILVKGGLTRSDYTYEDVDGKTKPATTYYLSTE